MHSCWTETTTHLTVSNMAHKQFRVDSSSRVGHHSRPVHSHDVTLIPCCYKYIFLVKNCVNWDDGQLNHLKRPIKYLTKLEHLTACINRFQHRALFYNSSHRLFSAIKVCAVQNSYSTHLLKDVQIHSQRWL